MQITLEQLSPVFLEKEKIAASEVWNKNVSFEPGEKIQLAAPSGSGKTSFIHFLYGLRKDYQGKIFFNDNNIAGFDSEDVAMQRQNAVSIVFQDLRLFPDHTARENIEIKKVLQPFPAAAGVEEMAGRLGIQTKLGQAAGICSYGEQQRIAIIRALQQPFEFLILDEPFSHLDENNARKAMELINEEVEKRKAGIILTDLSILDFYQADRTLKL